MKTFTLWCIISNDRREIIFDISQEVFSCNVYPGDTSPSFERVRTVGADLTDIKMCVHNGTHIDVPCHFIKGGKAVDKLPPEIFYGKCTVAEFNGVIDKSDIAPVLMGCRERLIFKGDCEILEDVAVDIANSHVKLIGVESQTVGNVNAPMAVHMILLGAEVIPLAGVNLSDASPGEYILSAFPLNLGGSDVSPVRAILIKDGGISDDA